MREREMIRVMFGWNNSTTLVARPDLAASVLTIESLFADILKALSGKQWRVSKHIPATSEFDDGTVHEVIWRFAPGVLPEVTDETYTCNIEVAAKLVRMSRIPRELVKDA